jgi:hypothetical protein
MEPKDALPCSQELATGPYYERYEPIPHSLTLDCLNSCRSFLQPRPGFPSGLLPSSFTTKILYKSVKSPMCATYPAHPIFLDLITLIILCEMYTFWRTSLCNFIFYIRKTKRIISRPREETKVTSTVVFWVVMSCSLVGGYTVSHPGRPQSVSSSPWEPQISGEITCILSHWRDSRRGLLQQTCSVVPLYCAGCHARKVERG